MEEKAKFVALVRDLKSKGYSQDQIVTMSADYLKDTWKDQALKVAVEYGLSRVPIKLLEQGMDPNSALVSAIDKSHSFIVGEMARYGLNLENSLLRAGLNENKEMASLLVKLGAKNINEVAALALSLGKLSIAQHLLTLGANNLEELFGIASKLGLTDFANQLRLLRQFPTLKRELETLIKIAEEKSQKILDSSAIEYLTILFLPIVEEMGKSGLKEWLHGPRFTSHLRSHILEEVKKDLKNVKRMDDEALKGFILIHILIEILLIDVDKKLTSTSLYYALSKDSDFVVFFQRN